MNKINNNKNFNDIEIDKIIIYKTDNCSLHNNYMYCDHIQKIVSNNIENNKIKNNDNKNIINNEMEKILCYTF
jgi:hypothetical protein